MRIVGVLAAAICSIALFAACTGEGEDVRPVAIMITANGCEPVAITVPVGQRLRLDISNETTLDYRVSAPEGGVDELAVGPGEEAAAFYLVPDSDSSSVIACTADDGSTSSVTLEAVGSPEPGSAPGDDPPRGEVTPVADAPADTTLAVTLVEYTITASTQRLTPGRINIIATNISGGQAHQLNVLELQPDGSFRNYGGLAAIEPQQGGAVLVAVRPGTYRLACLIGIGESGSTVDHYQQGMWTDIIVEE